MNQYMFEAMEKFAQRLPNFAKKNNSKFKYKFLDLFGKWSLIYFFILFIINFSFASAPANMKTADARLQVMLLGYVAVYVSEDPLNIYGYEVSNFFLCCCYFNFCFDLGAFERWTVHSTWSSDLQSQLNIRWNCYC